jgi:hypothetical protein
MRVKELDEVEKEIVIDVKELVVACDEYMEYLKSGERHEDKDGDYKNTIFEKALEAVFGKNIWDEIRKYKV